MSFDGWSGIVCISSGYLIAANYKRCLCVIDTASSEVEPIADSYSVRCGLALSETDRKVYVAAADSHQILSVKLPDRYFVPLQFSGTGMGSGGTGSESSSSGSGSGGKDSSGGATSPDSKSSAQSADLEAKLKAAHSELADAKRIAQSAQSELYDLQSVHAKAVSDLTHAKHLIHRLTKLNITLTANLKAAAATNQPATNNGNAKS